MPTPSNTSGLARYQETTQGTGPANAAAWVTDGVRVRHIMDSLDAAAFKQSTIEDERSRENVQGEGDELIILGIKGGIEFAHEVYLHGLEATTAAGDQVVQNELSEMFEHCLGGVHLSNSTTATGGTTTTAILTVDDDIEVGCHIGIVQGGRTYVRRVVAHNVGTSTVTLDQAMPATVAAATVIHGAATHYFDEDFLNDSSIGPTTWSWLLSLGRGSLREHWEANGCKSYIESISLPRNGAPKCAIKTKVASFQTPDELSDPSFTALPEGAAPLSIGTQTSVWLADYGSTANAVRQGVEVSFTPGGQPAVCETSTEVEVGMPGISHYGLTRDDTTVMLKTLFAQDEFADFTAGQLKSIRWSRDGGPGRTVAIGCYRAEVRETPGNSPAGPSMGMEVSLRAHRELASVGTTDLARSRFVIVLV